MNRLAATVLPLLTLFVLAACSKDDPPAPAQTAAPAATPAAPAAEQNAEPSLESDAEVAAAIPTETISETDDVVDTQAPASTAQPSMRMGTATTAPTSARFKEGANYRKIVPAQPTSVSPGKVEVVEVFWYGCSHCFTLDPAIESWRGRGKPAFADFVRVPAMWNDMLRMHARMFYTVEALGKLEQLHTPIFREIQINGNELNSLDKMTAFFRQHGIAPDDFQKAFSSFAVESKLQRADLLNRRFRVQSVPMVVVNGKYATDVGMAGGEQQLFALINELATHEGGG